MMNQNVEMLEVVDENDVVVGLESRDKIHTEGLLHREIHIWFFTPDGKIIFQHRAKDKDTYPDLLDATVGGHVEPGDSYEKTAVKECLEETGLKLEEKDFLFLGKIKLNAFDEKTNKTNYHITADYAYLYDGKIEDLKIEEGKSQGFIKVFLKDILDMSSESIKNFIPVLLIPERLDMYKFAAEQFGIH
jgi:isopentenyldiphosphate isomerase